MRVNYKGKDPHYNFRVAEISFDEETEQTFFDELWKCMEHKGWKIDEVTNGYALCEVEDYDEYKEFVEDYKEAKKEARKKIR